MDRTRFDICLDSVLAQEGGYADNAADPGGATNLGITRKTLARWRQVSPWWALPKADVQQLQRAEAARIYRAGYWDACKAGQLLAGLDLALFDFAVNSGPGRAVRSLQAELGVRVDGAVGPLTLGAARTRCARDGTVGLIEALCNRRLSFLARLTNFVLFGKGWTRRVAQIRAAALAAAGATAAPPPPSATPNSRNQTMDFLNGYKTYITAGFMLLAGIAQVLGIDLPALDSGSAGHLIMESLAVIFLRQGFKTDIGRA